MLPSTTFPRGVSTLHTDASGTAPPDAFGPFRVLHQIGVGVLGPVFRAYQPDPGRLVAVKQFRLDLPPESAHRFVAALEQLVAADLTHLGIAAPLAAGLVDNSPYLAMDFAAAESFDVVVRDYGPAPVSEALRIATQLGGALDFAAAVNVLHGSLHPRDVLVSTDDTRVTGLGIAHALQQVGVLPPIRRPYTAPERIAGLAWDRRADTFSLAALVYEMLFGRRIAGLGQEAADAIPSTDGMDVHAMRALFARALDEHPDERFETALGFADALHNAAAQPAPSASAPKSSRRRKPAAETPPTSPRADRPALPLDPEPELLLTSAEAAPELDLEPTHDDDLSGAASGAIAAGQPIEADTVAPEATAPDVVEPEPPGLLHGAGAVLPDRLPDELPDERPDELPAEVPAEVPTLPLEDAAGRRFGDSHHAIDLGMARGGAAAGNRLLGEPDFDDINLKQAEADRYSLVDDGLSALPEAVEETDETEEPAVEPAVEVPVVRAQPDPAAAMPSPTFSSVALEQSRSATWPLALALVVGLLVGFAFGYGAGNRARSGAAAQSARRAPPPAPAAVVAPPARARPPEIVAEPAAPAASAPTPAAPAPAPAAPAPTPAAPSPAAPNVRSQAPVRTAPARGRLLVRSTPSGARVLVDGRPAGETPLTMGELAFGSHVVRITQQGYVAAERRVRIGSAQPAQSIEVELARARPARGATPAPAAAERSSGQPAVAAGARTGSLMVDSRPIGARVFVDGRLIGTTPLLMDAVSAGDHSVRLEMDGFSTWATTTRVAGGQRNRVSGSLEQR